ncbi:MAG: glycogen/starch synthase [Alkalispirochaeta sp.]
MNILFVSSEYHPFAKAGGLADAVSSFAQALTIRGHAVSVVVPRYGSISTASMTALDIPLGVPLGSQDEWCSVYHQKYLGVNLYFLEHQEFFGSREGVYGPTPASAYDDNARRYAFLARGALQLSLALHLEPDIVHAHDWPTALVPAYIHLNYHPAGRFLSSRIVFSIHNFGYQGIFPGADARHVGFSPSQLSASDLYQGSTINFIKSAVSHSDWLVAVSPRYALEIQQPRFGFGLHREVQRRAPRVIGILNGIDVTEWDPASDDYLAATYSVSDLTGKAENKRRLQEEMGLPVDPRIPVVGMVTRLVDQKGIGPLFGSASAALDRICRELPVQVVLLGSGAAWVERDIRRLTRTHRNFAATIGYSNNLAHRIEAGSDFFLMPSTYEPCGLNQMYSMRYGTLPIVTRTGGLADTVDADTGFFIEESEGTAIFTAVERAATLFRESSDEIQRMRSAAMVRDFTWDRSAREYEELYRRPVA